MKLVLGVTAAAMWMLAGCDQYTRPVNETPKIEATTKAAPPATKAATAAATKAAATATAAMSGEIIIDNADEGFKVVSGTWNNARGDYYKDTVRWAVKADEASAVATWTPTIVSAGEYEVFEYHGENPSNDHATNAPYTIKFDGGSKEVAVDQTAKIGQWNSLGKFKFAAGTGGSVSISNKANDNVIADAVKFVKK
jgi:hypothetical protein